MVVVGESGGVAAEAVLEAEAEWGREGDEEDMDGLCRAMAADPKAGTPKSGALTNELC